MAYRTGGRLLMALIPAVVLVVAGCGDDGGSDSDGGSGDGGGMGDGSIDGEIGPDRDGSPPGDACESVSIDSEPVPTNVLVLLDSSNSMYQPDADIDRWSPAVMAVENATSSLESRIRFGLMVFPGDDTCGPGSVEVSPDLGNADAISSALSGSPDSMTAGGTPVATSIDAAGTALDGLEGDRIVLLVTDGAPNCNDSISESECTCTAPPGEDCSPFDPRLCLDDDRTISNISSLADSGTKTYVIGYETSAWTDVLDRMAMAGGTGRDTHIPVSDGTALEMALEDITRSVVSCSYELDSAPGDVDFVRVEVDGMTVSHVDSTDGGSSGWKLSGEKTVELVGDTCSMVQDGESHEIDITVECEPVPF